MIDNYLNTFSDILSELKKDDNIVLGGSMAMILHGINIGRDPRDLDIVLYQPTSRQVDYTNTLHNTEVVGQKHSPFSKDGEEVVRTSLEIVIRNGMHLNILSNSVQLRERYLYYKGYRIQPIDMIVEAKASYTYKSKTKGNYIRKKDIEDLQYIKNNNFNI